MVFWMIVKLSLTLFTAILIPIYWRAYGPQNFLWLSDIGLFLTVAALWINSPLLMSMATVGTLLLEIVWNIDFILNLLFGINLFNLAAYMFDHRYSLRLRGISLFHVITPIVWILYLADYGYDQRAFFYFTVVYWIVLLLVYTSTTPKENINWVFWPQEHGIKKISPHMWIVILGVGFPLLLFLPTHFLCMFLFKTV